MRLELGQSATNILFAGAIKEPFISGNEKGKLPRSFGRCKIWTLFCLLRLWILALDCEICEQQPSLFMNFRRLVCSCAATWFLNTKLIDYSKAFFCNFYNLIYFYNVTSIICSTEILQCLCTIYLMSSTYYHRGFLTLTLYSEICDLFSGNSGKSGRSTYKILNILCCKHVIAWLLHLSIIFNYNIIVFKYILFDIIFYYYTLISKSYDYLSISRLTHIYHKTSPFLDSFVELYRPRFIKYILVKVVSHKDNFCNHNAPI